MYCKTSGKSEDTCPGHSNTCKKDHCECIKSHYQQSSCEGCENFSIREQRNKQGRKEKEICDCGTICQQTTPDGLYCSVCHLEHLKMAEYCTKICKKIHSEGINSHYQQSSCEGCENFCICEQRNKQGTKEKDICDCSTICQQITPDGLYCSVCHLEHLKMAEYCTKICKKIHSECINSHYQQSSCESCKSHLCI